MQTILEDRKRQVFGKDSAADAIACERKSTAGGVSQRACVFCGSRVVLYPITDALHLVHGPIGCAAYTWDIRGSVSSDAQLYRMSFSTDLKEQDVIHGGEKKLYRALCELIDTYKPKAAFVYSTCIVGLIGDDVAAVCKKVAAEKNIDVLPVHSEGFKGTKKDGYRAACEALATLIGTDTAAQKKPLSINMLGEFNLAGETWMIKDYYKRMGVDVVAVMTGDAKIADVRRSHTATLNVVQCSGSMTYLAELMKKKYGIPYIRVSYFGIEDTAESLYETARALGDAEVIARTKALVAEEVKRVVPLLATYKSALKGKKAAVYVGGAFKVFSLIKALRHIGMSAAIVGSQTGNKDDYRRLQEICDADTVILDDSNPTELAHFAVEKDIDLFIGGVKERPLAYKLGIGFCDHNHERKIPLAGFEGMLHFAKEVHATVMSPVWKFAPRREVTEVCDDC
jgi:nitrogenase molybdenum-cofactor synthesis protein NifE